MYAKESDSVLELLNIFKSHSKKKRVKETYEADIYACLPMWSVEVLQFIG